MATHKCSLPHCDGTRLGHELARDFPKETAAINEAFAGMVGSTREDRVMPENLQVDHCKICGCVVRLADPDDPESYVHDEDGDWGDHTAEVEAT